ncbi:DUF4349 domain-containing protein [Gaoshiqia sp. Z1-71]|uniref:DUF4349 domain-containing protein n=1 Tax=Gaoshiqia hydrogeniformans TaxID=3290090 RepID=UPI003BF7B80C
MKQILNLMVFAFMVFSCAETGSDRMNYDLAGVEKEIVPQTNQSREATTIDELEQTEVDKKKIIKDGRLGLRVNELERSKSRIDSLVKMHGGYYANESFNNTDYESSYNLNVRIPCSQFENFILQVEAGSGEILYKEIDARDVTDQFIDLETRLANKRNYLARYQDLLKQAKTVKEILEIEEKIRGLEEEIESATGRLTYLADLVHYSTLNLWISKQKDFKYNPAKRGKFTERLKQSLSRGWFGFVDFVLFMIKIWPFWLIVSLILYLLKKYKKKRKSRN